MSKDSKRPAIRAEMPARIEKELETVRRLLEVLRHEFVVIAADEFLDLETQRTLLGGVRATDNLQAKLFGNAPAETFLLTSKRQGEATVIRIRITPQPRRLAATKSRRAVGFA